MFTDSSGMERREKQKSYSRWSITSSRNMSALAWENLKISWRNGFCLSKHPLRIHFFFFFLVHDISLHRHLFAKSLGRAISLLGLVETDQDLFHKVFFIRCIVPEIPKKNRQVAGMD